MTSIIHYSISRKEKMINNKRFILAKKTTLNRENKIRKFVQILKVNSRDIKLFLNLQVLNQLAYLRLPEQIKTIIEEEDQQLELFVNMTKFNPLQKMSKQF